MLEGEYLELVNALKERFNEKDREVEKMKEETQDLKKTIITVYGIIRLIDITSDTEDKENLIEMLRGYLSDIYDNIFINSS